MAIDGLFISDLCAHARTEKSGLWAYESPKMRAYAQRSLAPAFEHWAYLDAWKASGDNANLAEQYLASADNFRPAAQAFHSGYWSMAYGLQRFVDYLLPAGSNEERLTGSLIASLVFSPQPEAGLRYYWADASIGLSEQNTGSDFLLAVRWNDHDGSPCLSLAFIQVKKGMNRCIRVTESQHKKLKQTGAGLYLCLDNRRPSRCSIIQAAALDSSGFMTIEQVPQDEVTEIESDPAEVATTPKEPYRYARHDGFDMDFAAFTMFQMTSFPDEITDQSVFILRGDPDTFAIRTGEIFDAIKWRPRGALVVDVGTRWGDAGHFLRDCAFSSDLAFAITKPKPKLTPQPDSGTTIGHRRR